MGRTKRVFISDIHLGDERSMTAANPYCWFKKDMFTSIAEDAGLALGDTFKLAGIAGSDTSIVIFGHTHAPIMNKFYLYEPGHGGGYMHNVPCRQIYTNSGTWVDDSDKGCTYVETEEVWGEQRHYVRLKSYPGNDCIDEGYVNT